MEKLAITVDEMAELLSIGRNKAFQMIHAEGFPKIVTGRRVIIPLEPLKAYLAKLAQGEAVV